jgi:hypothetical protein
MIYAGCSFRCAPTASGREAAGSDPIPADCAFLQTGTRPRSDTDYFVLEGGCWVTERDANLELTPLVASWFQAVYRAHEPHLSRQFSEL